MSLFADDMIWYTKNPKDSTKKKPQKTVRINEFSKVAGYKSNIHIKTYSYTLTSNNQKEKLRKQSHLQLHPPQ